MGSRADIVQAEINRKLSESGVEPDMSATGSRSEQITNKIADKEQALLPPEPVSAEPVDFDLGTMVSNIPESGGQVAEDLYNVVRHPIDTATGIYNVVKGTMNKFTPDVQPSEKYADAVVDFAKERYGDMDKFKQTLMQDPVGVLGDFAGVLSLGSMAVPKYGSSIAKVAGAIDPLNLAVSGGSKLISNLPKVKNIPSDLYKSSAKFGKKFDSDVVAETALREKIMPTNVGIEKADSLIRGLNEEIDMLIDSSVESGQRIPRKALYKHLKSARMKIGGVKLDAQDDLKKLNKIVSKFEEHMKAKGASGEQLTAREVQEFKKGIYDTIKWKEGQNTGSKAKNITRKAIAKGAKEELEKIFPQIKGINIRQGELLELMDAIDAPATRIENRDLIGIGVPAKVIAGASVGDAVGGFLGFLQGISDSPTLKSKMALKFREIQDMSITDARKRVLTLEAIKGSGGYGQEDINK